MKDVLENFGKIQAPVAEPQRIFIKKRLGSGVFFLWILQNFQEYVFL